MRIGINENLTNEQYHGDRNFISSSGLKLLYTDPQEYYQKYVLGNWPDQKASSGLSFGTAAHYAILEPHLYATEVVTFTGGIRRGKVWEEFLAENAGKTILTKPEREKLDLLVPSYHANEQAVELVAPCQFEHSLGAVVDGVNLKCRCDGIDVDRGIIIDVKTTAFSSAVESFSQTAKELYYDLSAAVYVEVAKQVYDKDFSFYFIVLSKSDMNCRVFKTSKLTLAEGYSKMATAIETYKRCLLTNIWERDNLNSDEQLSESEIQEI